MTPEQKRTLDRILKLLAVANSTAFAGEADNARAIAEKLMAEHNVTVKLDGKPAQDTIECRHYVPYAKGMRWEGIICYSLADLCMANIYFNSEVLDHYVLVGTIWNLDCLQYMLVEVNRQRMHAWMQYKGKGGPDSFNKFCYGFAMALERKCKALASPALPKNHAMLKLWYETNVIRKQVTSTNLTMGAASSRAGLDAGANASLHRGAIGEAQKRLSHR